MFRIRAEWRDVRCPVLLCLFGRGFVRAWCLLREWISGRDSGVRPPAPRIQQTEDPVPCLTALHVRTRLARPFAVAPLRCLAAAITCCLASGCLPQLLSRPRSGAYRVPWLVMAYPERGGPIPADRPLVVFRFASSEPDDPVDPASFRAAVDGTDRTTLFRLTAGEAWAMLADSTSATPLVTLAPHAVSAGICSARGACARLDATLLITAPPTAQPR